MEKVIEESECPGSGTSPQRLRTRARAHEPQPVRHLLDTEINVLKLTDCLILNGKEYNIHFNFIHCIKDVRRVYMEQFSPRIFFSFWCAEAYVENACTGILSASGILHLCNFMSILA